MSKFVLEDSNSKVIDKKGDKIVRTNSITGLLADRNGNPPTQQELEQFQNRLMNRGDDFHKLSQADKEKIMFDEMVNWHFSTMPSIEQMKAEMLKNPVRYEVPSLNKEDNAGRNRTHINLKNENVDLVVISDGKTIKFNNKEKLEEYRQALKSSKEAKEDLTEVQKRGQIMHNERVFDEEE
ncbi:MAG: hypothetical protein ACRC5M_04895 [Anaeroplasmataceae bacterium]